MKKINFISFFLGIILLSNCTHLKNEEIESKKEKSVTFMTFNVETLFDSEDDPQKNDQTYLPISKKQTAAHKGICQKARFPKWVEECLSLNWNEDVVKSKLQKLASVIKIANQGQSPDILLLQEVENKKILERLNSEFQLGYKEIVLIEGKDARGIDVAILSKFELSEDPALQYVPYKKFSKDQREDSRGILEATFHLPGLSLITVYSLHLPAPFHPYEMRVEALEYLNQLVMKLPKDRLVVAGGDFNIPVEEDEKYKITQNYLESNWHVAHKVACRDCKGTTYYPKNNTWSFLDYLMIRKNVDDHKKWKLDKNSIRVVNFGPEQLDENGFPLSFDPKLKKGVSDHLPVLMSIVTH